MRVPAPLLLAPVLLLLLGSPAGAAGQEEAPFVGCASDGQTGPIEAPSRAEAAEVPAAAPPGLAYYATRSIGTLAPAGWHCFAAHGSNGERLVVAPQPIGFDDIVAPEGEGLRGPAVEMDHEYGFTSGRYAVAAMIVHFFPAHIDFAREIEAAGLPADPAPEPFSDGVTRLGADALAFRTPPGETGIGTLNALAPGAAPISGLVLLLPEEDMSMWTLSVRLPASEAALTRDILAGAAARRRLTLPPLSGR